MLCGPWSKEGNGRVGLRDHHNKNVSNVFTRISGVLNGDPGSIDRKHRRHKNHRRHEGNIMMATGLGRKEGIRKIATSDLFILYVVLFDPVLLCSVRHGEVWCDHHCFVEDDCFGWEGFVWFRFSLLHKDSRGATARHVSDVLPTGHSRLCFRRRGSAIITDHQHEILLSRCILLLWKFSAGYCYHMQYDKSA
jgi:hypothetical protein